MIIFLVSLTSHGKCCQGDNPICQSNSYERTNYPSEIFMSSQIQTFYIRYLYQNVSHTNRFLFLTRNHKWQRLHREVVNFTPVKDSYFFRQRRFNGLFEITPYIILIARLAITDFDTFLFLQIGGSPSSMSNPPNTHPPSSNLSFLKTPPPLPLQNFKKKKERRPRK